MYIGTRYDVPDFAQLLRCAQELVQAQGLDHGKGSFMVPFPLTPACLADAVLTNLGRQLVGLLPSQQIVGHRDGQLPKTFLRYHLPLQSNPGCWSFHRDCWQQLEVGTIYEMDPTEWHGAVNWGTELRLHLMIDVEG